MQKFATKTLSVFLAALMILSCLAGIAPTHVHAASFSEVEGWYESIYAQISGISDSDVTAVTYSGPTSGSLTGQDLEFLVRNTSGGVRIDIPGLKAGSYTLTVTANGTEYTQSNINVVAYDRSGYAHWNNTEGVGAYNDDGTLKSNAIVLYVTDSNKNSVTLTSKDGTTVTGIGNILNTSGMDAGSGTNAKGGKANTNQDILRRLAQDGTPLVVRIVGDVTAPTGLTTYDSVDYGGTVGDNGYMARMKDAMNITIEGIGNDSKINGWGFHFMCSDAYPNFGKNFEVRNLAFVNVPEDCVGMEGVQSGSTITASVERCWIHHCSFTGPSISNPAESDKDGGDGAVDFKRGQYFTNSYCVYEGYHKTNLVGASDSNLQFNITYHHNYYKNCESRGPLARQANIHIYNSVYENQSSYCMSLRADTYIFSEYNFFINSKVTDGKTGGECKSYNNSIDSSCTKTDPITVVSSKSQTVSSNNKYANFDTNSSLGYVAGGDYALETNTTAAAIKAAAGPMTTGAATTPEQGGSSGGAADPDATTPPSGGSDSGSTGGTTLPAGSYVHNFTENGTSSDFYTITGSTSTSKGSVSYAGLSLTTCLKMESKTNISFTAPTDGTLILVFGGSTAAAGKSVKVDGTSHDVGSDGTVTLSVTSGSHTITKGDSINLFLMSYASNNVGGGETHTHEYTATVIAPNCTTDGYTQYTCSCGDSYTGDQTAALGHSYSNGACTRCGAVDPDYVAPTEPVETQPGHTHSYTSVVTAATCDAAGYTTYTCSCGESYVDNYTTALGHKYSNGSCTVCGAQDPNSGTVSGGGSDTGTGTGSITECGGRLESAYVEWTAVSGASGYNVYVRDLSGSFVQLDTELIRNYGDYWRADALGLKAGSYCMKIVPIVNGSPNEGSSMVTSTLTVLAHDRGGYAHTNGSVGAYNNDGTLKSGAVVVYVTNANKDSVTANIGGTTYTGLQSIVYDSRKTSGTPICVRIIGELDIPSDNTSGQIQIKENSSPITIEGVGEDATCNGWGITLSTADNVEVRNLGFMNNASSEGDCVTLQKCTYCWVHNCDFFYGTDRGGDKKKGDGALDTKQSTYITHSYNHFWDCGKCNLQGSNSSDTSDWITYHHNWYDHADSRNPRVRVAHVHVYNNFYDGVGKYGIGSTTESDIFAENNYFLDTNYPMMISLQGTDDLSGGTFSSEKGGSIKAFGNIIINATSYIPYSSSTGTNFDCIEVANKSDKVTVANEGGYVYDNFDTNGKLTYSYTATPTEQVPQQVMTYSGRMNGGDFEFTFTDADDASADRNAELDAALTSYSTKLKSVGGNSVTASTPNDAPASGDGSHTHTYTASTTTSATCTAEGVITYTCDCGASYTASTPALGHNYVNGTCTRCGDTQSTTEPEETTTPGGTVTAGSYVHNFTENGKTSDFYSITGSTSTSKGSVTYDGLTLTTCLKMESSTNISFTAPSAGTLTLVFGGSTAASGKSVKVDSTSYDVGTDGTVTVDVAAGAHTVTKGDAIFLFYMVYTPESTGETHTHSYTSGITTAATCENAGVRTYTCECGDSYTESIAALGHSYTSVVTAPTCTAGGYTTYTCGNCGYSYQSNQTAALGHTEKAVAGYAATCTATGLTDGSVCSVCGEVLTAQEVIPALGHTAEAVPGKAATCTATGLTDGSICSVCGEVLTAQEVIPALGHTAEAVPGKAATCADTGLTEGSVCSVCGEVLTAQEVIPALGHTAEAVPGKAATCTATGLTDGSVCSVCGEVLTAQEVIPALGHSYTAEEVLPDCLNDGYIVYTCSACGHSYTEAGTPSQGHSYANGVCTYCGEADPNYHAHSYTSVVTAPTCTAGGYTTYTCACGDSYVADETPALGHTAEAVPGKAATCTATGLTDGSICSVCGEVLTAQEVIPALGHTAEAVPGKAATCTATGLTDGSICSVCDEVLTAQEVIPALGHNYTSSVKVPTCEEDGLRTYTCANCGDTYSEAIPAIGHTAEAVPGTAATCTATGLTEGSICSVCQKVLVAQEEIPMVAHSYANGVCSVCGAKDPDYVAPDPSLNQGLQKADDGNYYYYIDGVVQESFTGLVDNAVGRWYIANGMAQMSFDGVIEYEGTNYLIKAGCVNTAYTDLYRIEGGRWLYFVQGVQDTEFVGLITRLGMQAYVEDGEVNFNKTAIVEHNGNLVFVKYGIFRDTFVGLYRDDAGEWLYFVNGVFDPTYTGVAALNSMWVYVENGYVNFSFSGTITVGAYDYAVKYGVVQL